MIKLTEDVDDTKGVGQTLKSKSYVIEDKYKVLTELKDEMQALNEKLKGEAAHDNVVKIAPQQNDNIQLLTQKLPQMDQKIAHFDEILAEKDRQIAELKNKVQQQGLNLKAKDESIRWLNQVLSATKNKAEYYQLTSQENRSSLKQVQNEVQRIKDDFAQRFKAFTQFENAISSLKTQVGRFSGQLSQKQQQVDLLKSELENKITEVKNVDLLKSELENKITEANGDKRLKLARQLINFQQQEIILLEEKNRLRAAQNVLFDRHVRDLDNKVKIQLADQKNKVDLLKQELDNKNAQSVQMTSMMSAYQKKLESKNNAYNQELRQLLLSKNDHAKDLSLSMIQQKSMDGKIKEYQDKINSLQATINKQVQEMTGLRTELALARQRLGDMPSSDEIDFLRTGLKNATVEVKQKDAMLLQTKTNADEYEKEFKAQSMEFQSLKEQLQNAYDEIKRRNEDLKYKKLELVRFKERSAIKEGGLLDQVKALTRKLQAAEKRLQGNTRGGKAETQIILPAGKDALSKKLKEALDKIEEQGRMINVLAQKLQDAGQSVDLTRNPGKH